MRSPAPLSTPPRACGWRITLFAIASTLAAARVNAAPAAARDIRLPSSFDLREMDMHLHAGMERPVPLEQWIDLAVADGRRVFVLLDHLELYRKSRQAYAMWRTKAGFQAHYPLGPEGHRALFAHFDTLSPRRDILFFKGWEISEAELDSGLEPAAMAMAEVIGWHISPNNGGEPPNGRTLLRRVRQIKEVQRQFPIPMIVFHPFSMRTENLWRAAAAQGRDTGAISAERHRFFQGGEQDELIALLHGASIYIEMNNDTAQYFRDAAVREALIADLAPLVKAGVQFAVGSDNHHLRAAGTPFNPAAYCLPVGVTELNTNGLVRELLALRARRALRDAATAAPAIPKQ